MMRHYQTRISQIVDAHRDMHIPNIETSPSKNSTTPFSLDEPVYQIAKSACLQLGFIERDAECLAQAWLRMSPDINHLDPMLWPDEPSYFEINTPDDEGFSKCPHELGLYIVAPDSNWIGRLIAAGVKTMQLRFKSENPQEIEDQIAQAVELSKNTDIRLFINDHWQLAIKYQAYGIHLGQEDLDTADLDAIRNSGLRLGLSTHGYAEMVRAAHYTPSYIALGAIFPTTLKKMETAPQGLCRLKRYAKVLNSYPLVGIGGVDMSNIKNVLDTGVQSAALVRAVINAEDPELAIKQLNAYF